MRWYERPTAAMARTSARTSLLAAFARRLLPAWAQPDAAAGYPNKPVRLIVGFAAGGGTDAMARIFAPKLSEILGQPVVIENRAGRAGAPPSSSCRASPPTATPWRSAQSASSRSPTRSIKTCRSTRPGR